MHYLYYITFVRSVQDGIVTVLSVGVTIILSSRAVGLKNVFQRTYACTVTAHYLDAFLFGFAVNCSDHLVRAGAGEHHHEVWCAELAAEIRRHLSEHLCLAVVSLTDILISGRHAVVAAYYYYTHF